MQVRLFHLSIDKQILEKHLSCFVKYLVGQVGHGISTGLSLRHSMTKQKWDDSDQPVYPFTLCANVTMLALSRIIQLNYTNANLFDE